MRRPSLARHVLRRDHWRPPLEERPHDPARGAQRLGRRHDGRLVAPEERLQRAVAGVREDDRVAPGPRAHLACYKVKPDAPREPVSGIHASNHLGAERLDALKEDLLCLPSTVTAPSFARPGEPGAPDEDDAGDEDDTE